MPQDKISDQDLEAYLDEALPPDQMAAIEEALRQGRELLTRLREILARSDRGIHSLAQIWRRNRLSCPSREILGAYLLEALSEAEFQYVKTHLEVVGCTICLANLKDLQSHTGVSEVEDDDIQRRRRRYFQSSLGHLPQSR
ncbi:MAG: hypothetical protein ACUVQG_05905 [Thermogutta sp.]